VRGQRVGNEVAVLDEDVRPHGGIRACDARHLAQRRACVTESVLAGSGDGAHEQVRERVGEMARQAEDTVVRRGVELCHVSADRLDERAHADAKGFEKSSVTVIGSVVTLQVKGCNGVLEPYSILSRRSPDRRSLADSPDPLPASEDADHAARAAGMPLGGAFLSSHTGLEVAMIAPVEEMTWVRRKLSCAVETAWVIVPPASWVAV